MIYNIVFWSFVFITLDKIKEERNRFKNLMPYSQSLILLKWKSYPHKWRTEVLDSVSFE